MFSEEIMEDLNFPSIISFVFTDGKIPINKEMIEYDEVVIDDSDIFIELSQLGPALIVPNDLNLNGTVFIPNTREFITEDPEGLFSQYEIVTKEKLSKPERNNEKFI